MMPNSKSLANLQTGLESCKDELGYFNPLRAFDKMNEIQKMEDPKAYQPGVAQVLENKIRNESK